MSLSCDEFHKSVLALDPAAQPISATSYRLASRGGQVTISYFARPGVKLGGLLALPRADVTLEFEGLSSVEQEEFRRRFDIAFQRGGG